MRERANGRVNEDGMVSCVCVCRERGERRERERKRSYDIADVLCFLPLSPLTVCLSREKNKAYVRGGCGGQVAVGTPAGESGRVVSGARCVAKARGTRGAHTLSINHTLL
jgi:hypothetical protein